MEALSRMLFRAMRGGYLSRFRVDLHNAAPLEISHLLFIDDTLIICDADRDQILNLGHILLCFEAISGPKFNLWISKLVAVGHVPHQEELVDILNCSISSMSLKYLGLPLCASFKSKAIGMG
jgi:hypothetical protein